MIGGFKENILGGINVPHWDVGKVWGIDPNNENDLEMEILGSHIDLWNVGEGLFRKGWGPPCHLIYIYNEVEFELVKHTICPIL